MCLDGEFSIAVNGKIHLQKYKEISIINNIFIEAIYKQFASDFYKDES